MFIACQKRPLAINLSIKFFFSFFLIEEMGTAIYNQNVTMATSSVELFGVYKPLKNLQLLCPFLKIILKIGIIISMYVIKRVVDLGGFFNL